MIWCHLLNNRADSNMNDLVVHEEPTLFLLQTDPVLSRSLKALTKSKRLRTRFYPSSREFFEGCDPARPGCLLWEPKTPNTNELELFDQLSWRRIHLPVIVISQRADALTVVRALRAGALNFLEKSCGLDQLWEALSEALLWDADNRQRLDYIAKIERRLWRLTSGEREVLDMLVDGGSNKEIAAGLELSVRTIEVRRAKVMKKMKAKSLAELVRLALTAHSYSPEPRSAEKPDGLTSDPAPDPVLQHLKRPRRAPR